MQGEIRLSGLDGVLKTLKELPPEIVSKRGGPVRSALRKGALIFLNAEKANLQASLLNEPRYTTGLLLKNLIVSRGKAPTGGNGERYIVRIRRKTYPGTGKGKGGGKGKAVTTIKVAQLHEYGTRKQPAEPFIRPAFESKAAEVIHTVERELLRSIDRIVKKLAKQNKGK